MENYDVIVVGAGPAGLLAAGRAAELGGKVLILEKMRSEGRKLLITGKGRCNVSNSADIRDFISHVFPNGKFLRTAFSNYYSKDIIELLESYKVAITLERGGRYFPSSNKASDVLKAILQWVKEQKVQIICGQKVERITKKDQDIFEIIANNTKYQTQKVIIATGGKSYPATGSTGDGYKFASKLGHNVSWVRPALVPLETEGDIAQKLQGLNLKNVKAVLWINGKKSGEQFGEMIFTHFGLSGPIILTLSRFAVDALNKNDKVEITVDLKPALDEQKLDKRLLRDLDEYGKKQVVNVFKNWLPSSMIPVFIELLNIESNKECHQVSGKERKQIRFLLKNLKFKIIKHRSYNEAIITAGGIPTNEISQKTMESKIVPGLYFAGEIIDVDAETGGYNLQIAYSTGWLAGNCAMQQIKALTE